MGQLFTTQDKLRELKREMAQRDRVYKNLIDSGRLDSREAERRNKILAEIIHDYEHRDRSDRPKLDL